MSITVHNLESAIAFYRDTLGLNLQFCTDTMAFFDLNGMTIMLSIPESLEFDHPSSVNNVLSIYKSSPQMIVQL
ncbi:VOC family protein [Paenibacillus sp. J2TS4]|uniref:VOC family protein n=1 Tax=Paenibacillus sp. J2TS4 TaxID=2807194 RepID=UPI001BD0B363